MSRFISKKRALLVTAVTSLTLVAVAIAFYSTAGSGDGDATTRDGYANNLVVNGSPSTATLVPGGSVSISGTIQNNNPGAAKVGTITGTVDETPAGCNAAWFFINGIDVPDADDVVAANSSIPFSATLNMTDAVDGSGNPVDQNACKNAAIDIDWSSN